MIPDDGLRAAGPTAAAPLTSALPGLRPAARIAKAEKARPICRLIETSALRHDLPPAYFARLIWRESRFDARALSPKGAQGIAQFMPATATLVGLQDPWDPTQAIPASAAHLADLRRDLGNLGLAAAGYNAGAGRVTAWRSGRSGLPYETRAYVEAITGRPAEWFLQRGREVEARPLAPQTRFEDACSALPVMRTRASGVARLPWGVQIAGNIVRSRAVRHGSQVKARFGQVVGAAPTQVVATRGPRGTRPIWTYQLGARSYRDAITLCSRLKSAGGACLVRKN
ncbi:MAG: lytic transglycosylase domain-containing protein [Pseudomonadota bacterium]